MDERRTDERIAGHKGGLLQRTKVSANEWTHEKRQIFLDELARTCNVSAASRAAGIAGPSIYNVRRNDPVFAGLWREAMLIGYERLEAALLSQALVGVNALEVCGSRGADAAGDSAAPPPPMTLDQVHMTIAILNRHDAAQRRAREAPRGLRAVTLAEAENALTKRLEVVLRRRIAREDPA